MNILAALADAMANPENYEIVCIDGELSLTPRQHPEQAE